MTTSFLGTVGAALVGAALLAGAAAAQDRTGWPATITVGTANEGGTYHVYGSGWANLVAEELGLGADAQVTGGPVQNAALVQTGDLDFGMVTLGPAYEAWNGESPLAPGLEHDRLRAMFPMYQTPFQVAALASTGIDTMEELSGKIVGVGPAGGTADAYFPRFLDTLGVDDVEYRNGSPNDLASQLQDGLIDALVLAGNVPISTFTQLESQADANIFSFTPAQIDQLLQAYPFITRYTVPAGTYAGITEPQDTVAMWNFAVASADMPESLVYEIVGTVMENHDRMVEIHGAAVETVPENALQDTFLPYHPGAVRWFEERGIDIPDNLQG